MPKGNKAGGGSKARAASGAAASASQGMTPKQVMEAQALKRAGYSSETELQAAIQAAAAQEQAWKAQENIPQQFSKVIIPKGYKYGAGTSKEQKTGYVAGITKINGIDIFTVLATDSKGRERRYDLHNPVFTRTNTGYKLHKK